MNNNFPMTHPLLMRMSFVDSFQSQHDISALVHSFPHSCVPSKIQMKCSSSTLHLNVSKLLPSFNHYKNLLLDFEKIGNVLGHLKTTRGNLKQFSQMLWIVLVTSIFFRSRDIFTAVFCLLDTLMSGILILEHVKRPKITANKKDKKLLPHFKRLMFRRDSFTPKTKSHYSSYW